MQSSRKIFSYENLLYTLLFLFPLFSTVLRHWTSTLFGFLVLLGIVWFFSKRKQTQIVLHHYEKIFLWLLAIHFCVFAFTSILNYPERFRYTRFEIELRFLLVIPFYLLLTQYQKGFRYLITGGMVSILIALPFCLYSVYYEGKEEFAGIYSRLFSGPILLIYLSLYMSSVIPKIKFSDKQT